HGGGGVVGRRRQGQRNVAVLGQRASASLYVAAAGLADAQGGRAAVDEQVLAVEVHQAGAEHGQVRDRLADGGGAGDLGDVGVVAGGVVAGGQGGGGEGVGRGLVEDPLALGDGHAGAVGGAAAEGQVAGADLGQRVAVEGGVDGQATADDVHGGVA